MHTGIRIQLVTTMIFAALFLIGCLCGEAEPTADEEPIPPLLSSVTTSKDQVEVQQVVHLTAMVDAPEDTKWYLEWNATCGLVIQTPNDKNRATFRAPTTPRVCNITATVYDKYMDHPSHREVQIQVNETLEREIVR